MSVSNLHTCPICLDRIGQDEPTLSHDPLRERVGQAAARALEEARADSPVIHLFHRDCLIQWLTTRFSCPLCRAAGDVFQIPQESMALANPDEALQGATIAGNAQMVRALVSHPNTSNLAIGCALIEAVFNEVANTLNICDILLGSGRVIPALFQMALQHCQSRDMHQELLARSGHVAGWAG